MGSKYKPLKLYVTDLGDPSVGVFRETYEIDCPFYRDYASEEDLNFFKERIKIIYNEFSESRLVLEYDFEKINDLD